MDTSDLDYSVQMMLQDPDAFQDKSRLRMDLPHLGFDNSCGKNWVYPTNYPKREYQYSISKKALFQNTLVVLPTGLGKTFIAAVVMYNFYRWYPKSKVIFMAPARPLVTQQISACYDIMGIPKEDTVEITGRKSKKHRQEFWKSKRVFFATPQAVLSDMLSPEHNFPVNDIRLVVIDEAHKAKGKYAYTEVINYISERNRTFRVLALSATPGRDLKDVREIAQNLLISHIEVRYETSIDVAPYTFKKLIKTEVVQLDSRIKRIRTTLLEIMDPYVQILKEANVLSGNTGSHSKGWIIMQQNEFKRLAAVERPPNYQDLASSFSTCVSLYHSLEVLERHGCRMFLNSFLDEDNRTGYKYFVNQNHHLKQLLEELKQEMGMTNAALDRSLNQSVMADPNFDFGHPKFEVLQQKLLKHFTDDPDSKVIVFCELRETVLLIDILLSQHKPLIRPRKMVGQGSSSGIRSVTQKEQLAVMTDFKKGLSNCLVATCVVEEGIDVGDVMMIVCFDSNTNPTRYVQRIGRTGRKQQGKVLMLVAEGREHDNLKNVLNRKDKTTQKLCNKKETEWFLYKDSPRLVPPEFNPECLEVCFDIQRTQVMNEPTTSGGKAKNSKKTKEPKGKKAATKKTTPAGTDMRKFFKPLELDEPNALNDTQDLVDMADMPENSPVILQRSVPRVLPKPKVPSISSTSTVINFTLDQSVSPVIVEELSESDQEWQMLQQMRKKGLSTKRLEYATDKEILDAPTLGDGLKKVLLLSRDTIKELRNPVLTETESCLKRISQETEMNFDRKRVELLIECVQNIEKQLKEERIPEIIVSTSDENFELPEISMVMSQFPFPLNSQPSRYSKDFVDSPIFRAFDRALTKVPAESTPIRKRDPTTPQNRPKTDPNGTKFEKSIEEEVLNSLGLKSIDDLFADEEFGDNEFADDVTNDQNLNPNVSISSVIESTKKDVSGFKERSSSKTSIMSNMKRPREEMSSPVTSFGANKKQKLEFVDLGNIFGSSDEDLFGDFEPTRVSQLSTFKSDVAPMDPIHEDTVPKSPTSVLEESLSKLNSSLPGLLVDELVDVGRCTPESRPKIVGIIPFSTPRSSRPGRTLVSETIVIDDSPEVIPQKIVIEDPSSSIPRKIAIEDSPKVIPQRTPIEKSPEPIPVIKTVTPDPPETSTNNLNETSPSMFRHRYSPQMSRSNLGQSSSMPQQGASSTKKVPIISLTSPMTQVIRPVIVRNKRQRNILSDSEDEALVQRTPKKARKKKSRLCSFLDAEAGVDGNDSDEDDPDMTGFLDLQGFVDDNNDTVLNETNMFAKYVQSTRSPNARNRFKMPQQLRPYNPEEIFSQAVPIEPSQYDLNDSFVVEDEENEAPEEMSELEIAEAVLEAKRKERKRNRQRMLKT